MLHALPAAMKVSRYMVRLAYLETGVFCKEEIDIVLALGGMRLPMLEIRLRQLALQAGNLGLLSCMDRLTAEGRFARVARRVA